MTVPVLSAPELVAAWLIVFVFATAGLWAFWKRTGRW